MGLKPRLTFTQQQKQYITTTMARGFNAGENRLNSIGRNQSVATTYAAERDSRPDAVIQREAKRVSEAFDKALREFTTGKTDGFGARQTMEIAWMPKADELPSKARAGEFDSSEEAASYDARAIMKAMPQEERVALYEAVKKEGERMQKNSGDINENGVSAKVAAALEKSNPAAYEALKNITGRIAMSRSSDIKKEIEAKSNENEQFKDLYEDAWKAARDAFASADSVAKMVLKKGDESYGETREFVGTKGVSGEAKEIVSSLRNGEPSVSGRVIAVNAGILMAKRAMEDAIGKTSKEYSKLEKKNPGLMKGNITESVKDDVRRLVMEKMIADKGAFLSVRGYIPPTAIYIGPTSGNANPVQHIEPAKGRFTGDIQGTRLGVG